MDAESMNALFALVSGPVLLASTLLAAVAAIVGMALGRIFLKRHFERAGVVGK
jgi:hypothetical protein